MTPYNLIVTVTKEQMTNHILSHGPGEQLNIKVTFFMTFLLFIYFWEGGRGTAAAPLNIRTGYLIELKQLL